MAVEQYKLQYLVDWELIIPIQLNPVEKEVVSTFLESKHVGYTMKRNGHYARLTSITCDSILRINDREKKIIHYSNKPIICKNTN